VRHRKRCPSLCHVALVHSIVQLQRTAYTWLRNSRQTSCVNEIKLKVKFPRHEDILGGRGSAPRVLKHGTSVGDRSVSGPNRFNHRERVPGTHWIRGLMGPRVGMDTVTKKIASLPLPGIEPRSSSPYPSHHTDEMHLLNVTPRMHLLVLLLTYVDRQLRCVHKVFK